MHQFHLLLISLVITLDLFHHWRLANELGITTIEQFTKCTLFSSIMNIVYTIELDGLICFGMWVLPQVSYIVYI